MTVAPRRTRRGFPASRAFASGAPRSFRVGLAVLALVAAAGEALGQTPPDSLPPADTAVARPDSVGPGVAPAPQGPDSLAPVPDTLNQVPDSVAQVPDSVAQVPDSVAQVPDSVAQVPDSAGQVPDSVESVDPDTIPVPVMPRSVRGPALGWTNGVWEWDRDAIRASRATELEELLSEIPGSVSLRGGHYGMPRQVSAFAAGPGRIRVFWDGFEMLPVEGGVADLARIGLGGVDRVRVERTGAGLRVELWSVEQRDRRPYTLIETGTGELETQQFRGTFGHPRALGGKLYLALDRLDTQGTDLREPGTSVGYWVSYGYEPNERWGVRAELRSLSSERDTLYLPGKVTRRDWTVRARTRLFQAAVAEVFAGSSSISASDADSLVPFREVDHDQFGVRLGYEQPLFWLDGTARVQTGDGVANTVLEARAGVTHETWGGVEGGAQREGWEGEAASSVFVRAWTGSRWGFSAFGSVESGRRGVPFVLPPVTVTDPPADTMTPPDVMEPPPVAALPPRPRFTDRTATRLGVQFAWRGLHLSGATIRLDVDSLHPLGLPLDDDGIVVAGGVRTGFEVVGAVPLLLEGLALRGSFQRWHEGPSLRYLPAKTWKAELDWNRTLLESGNLQFLATVGVQGRDAMLVPFLAEGSTSEAILLQTVPWYQSWFARLQIRILTFRIFITGENLVNHLDNQDIPGRVLPGFRTFYGVRWTLWN